LQAIRVILVHQEVDVGTGDQRHAPVGHREVRVESRGRSKAERLIVIEGERQAQP
jgi:hypothetical protein